MSDTKLNQFISRGTNAQRVAFTPSPATPASGNSPSFIFYETDTTNTYMWDGSAWQKVNNSSGSVTTTGSPASGNLAKFSGAATVTNGDLSGDVTTSGTLATTIANDAVTYAKMQNVSAASKLLGRGSASGAGDAQEITLGTGLTMSGTTLSASGGGTTTNALTITSSGGASPGATFDGSAAKTIDYSTVGAAASSHTHAGNLIGVQVITATGSGTYTPTAGTNSIVIEMVGGGGGGGAVPACSSSQRAIGRGGGAGAYLLKRLTANFSGASYSVGAKGTGGAAGSNPGSSGGNTTFTDTAGSPTTYTAAGGSGGSNGGATAGPGLSGGVTAGGAATNGDINTTGQSSFASFAIDINNVCSGGGGHCGTFGSGGAPQLLVAGAQSAGANATGKGAGGGGAAGGASGTAQAGGNGADGMIRIWEYS